MKSVNVLDIGVLGLFLYFPEDKSEYIPSAFPFMIFFAAVVFMMRTIIKYSKRGELKIRELEEEITKVNQRKGDSFR